MGVYKPILFLYIFHFPPLFFLPSFMIPVVLDPLLITDTGGRIHQISQCGGTNEQCPVIGGKMVAF